MFIDDMFGRSATIPLHACVRGAAGPDANLHSVMATHGAIRHLSGGELRQLLEWRRRLRAEIVGLTRVGQRQVLDALEEARGHRLAGASPYPTPTEMSRAELIHLIKWRVDAAGLEESAAAIRALDRARRAQAETARRISQRGAG